MKELIAAFAVFGFSLNPFFGTNVPEGEKLVAEKRVLAQASLDLTLRNEDSWVSQVMADNILLTLYYLGRETGEASDEIEWEKIREPFSVSFTLKPGEVFAFHQDVFPEFQEKVAKTTGATFHSNEGFKSDSYLFGDGVCHLASLMNQVASEAGLKVTATNHDFWPIPGVPQEFGTAIYYLEGNSSGNRQQNLYIENTFDFSVKLALLANKQQIKMVAAK